MNKAEMQRFEALYARHLQKLALQGKSAKTIDAYGRAVRRLVSYFDRCADELSVQELEQYFALLVEGYSWSTVKLDRLGLMFFWRHVLEKDCKRSIDPFCFLCPSSVIVLKTKTQVEHYERFAYSLGYPAQTSVLGGPYQGVRAERFQSQGILPPP